MKRRLRVDYCTVIVVVCILVGFFVSLVSRGTAGDDYNFVIQSKEYSLIEWVYTRFMTRSGRVAAEVFIWIFAHVPLIYWKVVTMGLSIFLCIYIYKYAVLFGNKPSKLLAVSCALVPFGMNKGAFVDGTLWVTGAMNYMWIAVPGIIGIYHVVKAVFEYEDNMSKWEELFSFVLIMITVSSSEQMGLVIIVLLLLVNVWCYVSKAGGYSVYRLFLFVASSMLYVLDVVLSPGVALRKEQAIAKRIPDFLTVSLNLRIEYSVRWIMDALVNHMGIFLNLVWFIILIAILKKENKNKWDKFVIVIVSAAEFMTLLKKKVPKLFEFEASWGILDFTKMSYVIIGIWIIVLLVTVLGVFLICNTLKKRISAVLLLLASYATTAIMIFSPTMYESGCRVVYHASLLIIVLVYLLVSEIKERKVGRTTCDVVCLCIMIVGALYHCIELGNILWPEFTIHLEW